jgi:hypothetical protein
MSKDHQIEISAVDVNALANAVERAEFIDMVPELQPENHARHLWCCHPAVSAYWSTLRRQRHPLPALSKHPHTQRRELQRLTNACKAEYDARTTGRVNDAFQGGIRRVVDAHARYYLALEDLRAVEAAIGKKNRARRKAKWIERMRPEFVTIGGELYPVSK